MKSMKSIFLFLTICMSGAGYANGTPLEVLIREGCDSKLEELMRQYLRSNDVLVSIYVEKSGTDRSLDLDSLKLCASQDLDPGSWNLRRETSFCNKFGDKVSLFTYGNLYCSDEVVLGVKDISLSSTHP